MFQITVLYNHPTDVAAFDKHHDEVHVPLAASIPGLQRYTVGRPTPGYGGASPYHLVAVLEFADEATALAGLSAPEGEAATADLNNFAAAGVTLLQGAAEAVVR
ncbi:EthD family reductase [Amycolatopsis sp. cmx-4-68]|uniref:EthD family reductase n=1 Tax=Amycolatopsis sp. cmx-4-68 TaxID=2790938 RepID=UPI00397945C4